MAALSEDEIKHQLQQMDPYKFEELVAEVWELQGYQTEVRQGSGDRGIDIEATKQAPFSQKILIQAKRYSGDNKIGSEEVRSYATLYQQLPDADTVAIVTTGKVTSEARRLAQDLSVKIVDGDSFAEMVSNKTQNLSTDLLIESPAQNTDKSSYKQDKKTVPKKRNRKTVSDRSKPSDTKIGKVGTIIISAIFGVPTTFLAIFVIGFPISLMFSDINPVSLAALSYSISVLFWIWIISKPISLGKKSTGTKSKQNSNDYSNFVTCLKSAIPTAGVTFLFIVLPILSTRIFILDSLDLEDVGVSVLFLILAVSYCSALLYWVWEWHKHNSQSEYQNDRFSSSK